MKRIYHRVSVLWISVLALGLVSTVGTFDSAVPIAQAASYQQDVVPVAEPTPNANEEEVVPEIEKGPGTEAVQAAAIDYNVNGNYSIQERLGVGIEPSTHQATVRHTTNDDVLRLIGPDTRGSGAKLNWGDGDYVYIDEDADDRLTIYASRRTALMGGNVGVGTTIPDNKLHVVGNRIHLQNGPKSLFMKTSGSAVDIESTTHSLFIQSTGTGTCPWTCNNVIINPWGANGRVGIGTAAPATKLDVNGTTRTSVLQITGGADIAEPFAIAGSESVEPGMVVSINPDAPGELRLANSAYDPMVAGVVSGAGGINPGLTLQQEGTIADGTYPVSLTGRVYVWADASYSAITAGQMLTTSNTPGHAMSVNEHENAQGAILGKAMTSLDEGTGLVLMLVTLQ